MDIQTLYRIYVDDELQYVGVSGDWLRRMRQHQATKDWFEPVTAIILERYPDRQAVLAAEQDAIEREGPLHNVQHNRRRVRVEVSAEIKVRLSTGNVAMVGALACAAVLGFRWLADAGSSWWIRRRAAAAGGEAWAPPPRDPFTEDPQPLTLTLMLVLLTVAASEEAIQNWPVPTDSPTSPDGRRPSEREAMGALRSSGGCAVFGRSR